MGGFFCWRFGANPHPGNLSEIHTAGGRGLQHETHRDLIPPPPCTLCHGKVKKRSAPVTFRTGAAARSGGRRARAHTGGHSKGPSGPWHPDTRHERCAFAWPGRWCLGSGTNCGTRRLEHRAQSSGEARASTVVGASIGQKAVRRKNAKRRSVVGQAWRPAGYAARAACARRNGRCGGKRGKRCGARAQKRRRPATRGEEHRRCRQPISCRRV